jgi:hypothetical protein
MNVQTKTWLLLDILSKKELILANMMAILGDSVLLSQNKLIANPNLFLIFLIFITASFIPVFVQEEKLFLCSRLLPFFLPLLCTF